MPIHSVLDFAHVLAARALESGSVAVDATVGNGLDTAFLAEEVSPQGRVIGFDIQAEAIARTEERLQEKAPGAEVQLLHTGHEAMADHLSDVVGGDVDVVMFNLGYLPGGDHSITTEPETTRQGLTAAADLLRPGGVITVVVYTGHAGGSEEAEVVDAWAAALPQDTFQSLSYRFVNQGNNPPRLLAIEKRMDAF